MDLYDVTILGGGPAGLYSAFYSGLRDLKTKIIEFQPVLGGKLHIFSEKVLWDVGGQKPIVAAEFIDNLVAQAKTFEPTICLNTKVDYVCKNNNIFEIQTANGDIHYSKTIIVATGGGILNPIKLDVAGAERYEMKNLHYTIKEIERLRDRHILISGGGNSAIDWAVELIPIAKKVTVIYRKEQLTAHEAQIKKLQQHGVEILLNAEISSLIANEEKTKIVHALVVQEEQEILIPVDDIIVSHGFNREVSLQFEASIEPQRTENQCLVSLGRSTTSVHGIFAAGDIVSYVDKVGLIVGTFQDAVLAVNSAKMHIEPNANEAAMVSSHNDKFQQMNETILTEKYATIE